VLIFFAFIAGCDLGCFVSVHAGAGTRSGRIMDGRNPRRIGGACLNFADAGNAKALSISGVTGGNICCWVW
jgi:hypothetical protein